MEFDELLSGHLGDFGRYQKRVYFLVCLPAVYCALNSFAWTFTGADVPHRCRLSPSDQDFSRPPGNGSSVPLDEAGRWLSCQRWATDGALEPCTEGLVWDNSERGPSALQDWELVCGRAWLKALVQSLYYAGIFCGSLCMGYLGDEFGRKRVLLVCCVLLSVSSTGAALCPNVWAFVAVRFFQGFVEPGVWQMAFVVGVELVGPSKRLLAGLVIEYFFSVGLVLLGCVAWAYRGRWEWLQAGLSVPGLAFLAYEWAMPESPRWLLAKGRRQDAFRVLRDAATVNRVHLSQDLLDGLKGGGETAGAGERTGKSVSYLSLIRTPKIRRKTLIICYSWAVVTLVYYGISLNPSALAGDFYLSFILASLVEFVGVTGLILTLNRVGRRPVQSLGFLVAGGALVALLFVPDSLPWLTLTLVLVAKMAVVSAFCTIYLYTSEVFPTVVRSLGIGLASTCARVGGMASPFASLFLKDDAQRHLLLAAFGVSSIGAGLLTLGLPETVGLALPESLADGEAFPDARPSLRGLCGACPDDLALPAALAKKASAQPLVSLPRHDQDTDPDL